VLGAGPSNQEDIPGRYHRSSSARRESRPPLHLGDACWRVSTGDIEGPLPCMRIGAVLRPTVLLALADGASILEHANRPSAHRPYRRPSFTCHQHGNGSRTANRFLNHSFRLLTHGWDSQWRELEVWFESLTRRHPVPELSLAGFVWARAASAAPGSREPSRKASRPSGFDPSRDHESLAGGTRPRSRRHFIPASLSLPFVRVPS
jgi:hypothetical protein